MAQPGMLTLDNVLKMLRQCRLLDEAQTRHVLVKGDAQAARLRNLQQADLSRRFHQGTELVTPAEVISSFNLEIPGSGGQILTEDLITERIAAAVGRDYLKIDPLKLDMAVVTSIVPRLFALKHMLVAVERQGTVVTVAVADPFATRVIDELQRTLQLELRPVLSSKTDILKIIREFFGFRASVQAAQSETRSGIDLGNLEQFVRLKGTHEIEGSDKHVVNAVEFLLHYAFDQGASDIHIEPKREVSLIRIRIDGVLHNIHTVPKALHAPMVSRIKTLARLDLTEKRRPQDGRIKTGSKGKEVELRVSTLPVAFGEKVVIRIFDPDVLMQDLDRIGFYPREYQLFNGFIRRPNGIVLVTGPTGSGKTTTLYSSLRAISSAEVNIVTVEDPIEMVMEEFNQVGVQSAIGVTFGTVLRNILRQDPDIIMVGEIRDQETAENAVQAALTGHLVLSTLHTNDAPSAVTRLLDLGVPAFLLASTVVGIVAQRLLRKICSDCREERFLTAGEIEALQLENRAYRVFQGKGCSRCRGTGYRGRTGIFEVLDFSEAVRGALNERAEAAALQRIARAEGLVELRQVAIRKLLEGVTTFEEVVAVT